MPFPLTITTDPDWSSEISAISGVLGPFEIGGLFYVLLEHVSTGALGMWQSTDATGSAWNQVGGDSPLSTGQFFDGFQMLPVGDLLYVFTSFPIGFTFYVAVMTFDTSTLAWSALYESTTVDPTGSYNSPLAYRALDNKIIFGLVSELVSGHYRTFFMTFDITTFTIDSGSAVDCGVTDNANPNDCLFIQNGMVRGINATHILMVSGQNLDGTTPGLLLQQTLKDDGTLIAVQTVDTEASPNFADSVDWRAFNGDSDGTTVVMQWQPLIDSADGANPIRAFQGSSADTISFAESDLSVPDFAQYVTINRTSDLKTAVCFNDSVDGSWGYFLDSGSGFGALTPFGGTFSTTDFLLGLGGLSDSVAFYIDGSSYFYLLALGGPPPVPPPPAYFTLTFKGMKVFGA